MARTSQRSRRRAYLLLLISLAVSCPSWLVTAPLSAEKPIKKSYAELRDQAIHYLKFGKRTLAQETLEEAWRLGGRNDDKLILVLAKLYQEDGNIDRVFEIIDAGPQTERIDVFRAQLKTLYGRVLLEPLPGASTQRAGHLSLIPDAPIINQEKKSYFASLQTGVLASRVVLPLELILPTGRYRVNGKPLEAVAGGKTRVEVPFHRITAMVSSGNGKRGQAIARKLEQEIGTSDLRLVDLGDPANASAGVTETATREPALLITVGLGAAQRAYRDLRDVPLLMLDLEEAEGERFVRRHGQATAIWSDLPRWMLFEKAREMVPRIQRVGVVLNRDRSWVTYEAVLGERPQGMRLMSALVTDKGGIAANLLRLRPHIDALWILPDAQLFDQRAVYLIAAWSFREKIPLLVERIDLVNQGAMLGAEVRWEDQLELGARLARRILWDEQEPSTIPPQRVEQPSWGVNLAVCRHLDVEVPGQLDQHVTLRSEEVPRIKAD